MQKDFVLSRTKSYSVVPPKFAGRTRALLSPVTGGTVAPYCLQGRSSRATFSRPLTGAHTCRSLSGLARPIYLPGHCCFRHMKMWILEIIIQPAPICQRWIFKKGEKWTGGVPGPPAGGQWKMAVGEVEFIFPNFGAFFAGNTGHFKMVVLL